MNETFRHSTDMGEISGFGGSYEECCQDMLEAGVKWLNDRAGVDLAMSASPQIFGLLSADSDDAKALEGVILDAAKGEATGAMHHAVMARLGFIAKNGWPAYCAELRKRDNA